MLFILAAMLTMLAVILLAVRPYWGVLLVLAAKPLIDTTWNDTFAGVNLLQIIGVAMPVLLLPRLLTSPYWRVSVHRKWLRLGVMLTVVQLFSVILMVINEDIVTILDVAARNLNVLLGFVMLPVLITNQRRFKQLLVALIIAGVFPMLVSVYQNITGTVWNVRMTVGFQRMIGLYHDAVSIRHFGLQSILAALMVLEMFRPKRMVVRLLLWGYLAGAIFMLYHGYTRGGIVTIVIWGLIWSILNRKIHWAFVIFGALLFLQMFIKVDFRSDMEKLFQKEIAVYEGDIADERMALNGRMFIWENLLGKWSEQDALVKLVGGKIIGGGHAHNEVLRMLLDNGLVGLFTYMMVMGVLSVWVLKHFLKTGWRSSVGVFPLMLLIMYWVEAFGATPGMYPQYQWYVFGLMGLYLLNGRYLMHGKALDPRGVGKRPIDAEPLHAYGRTAI